MQPDSPSAAPFTRWGIAAGVAAVALLATYVLPDIALDTRLADLVVLLTDTASIKGFPGLAIVVTALVAMRPGVSGKRLVIEAVTIVLAMSVIVILVTLANEHVVKPAFATPRPNIVDLTDSGALGPEFPDADTFYAIGDKEARRTALRELLPGVTTPALSDTVRDHWIHETGYAFPSGHAIAASTLATIMAGFSLMWLGGKRRLIALTIVPLWAIGVAYSRVLLNVHRPLEVVVGAVIGVGCGLLVLAALRTMIQRFFPD